ncbi:MAG TPA: site-2 protease family protein, partial [Spirochaetia bacterium]|nr:site-2 protease family protein [Spirochaetia bacterium]
MIGIFLLGLIGLGIMVFVHELGHFVAAKANGVAVETFSLGWGPKLVGFKR